MKWKQYFFTAPNREPILLDKEFYKRNTPPEHIIIGKKEGKFHQTYDNPWKVDLNDFDEHFIYTKLAFNEVTKEVWYLKGCFEFKYGEEATVPDSLPEKI